jgi:hypothetical protein
VAEGPGREPVDMRCPGRPRSLFVPFLFLSVHAASRAELPPAWLDNGEEGTAVMCLCSELGRSRPPEVARPLN